MRTQQNGRYTLALTSDITCVAHTHSPAKIHCCLDTDYAWRMENGYYAVPILNLWLWQWLENDAWRIGQGCIAAKKYINRFPILHFTITKNTEAHKRTGRPIP